VVRKLATYDGPGDPEGLLADSRTLLLVAFDSGQSVGFVLAHELPRRHGDPAKLFVYEIDVAESHRRRGVASALLAELAELARERRIETGFVRAHRAGQWTRQRALPKRRRRDRLGEGRVGVLVRGRLTSLRRAGAEDVDRLVAWHADPEVSRYWDCETFTRAEMEERLARDDVEAWIVEEEREPVGYL